MTTTPDKPVRRTQGRVPPDLPPKAPTPPPQPPSAARPTRKSKKQGGLPPSQVAGAVHTFRQREQSPTDPPPTSSNSDAGARRRMRNYPEYSFGQSDVIMYPEERLLAPIRKPLEQIGNKLGVRPYQFFSDWLEIVEFTLEQLPGHLAHTKQTGNMEPFAPGTPQEKIDRWHAIFTRYGSKDNQSFVYKQFHEAFHALLDATAEGIFDFIGHIYQFMELTDKQYHAQYFTPMSLAFMMAAMLQPSHTVYEHIYQALTHPDNIAGQALLWASMLFTLEPRPGQEDTDAPVVAALAEGAGDFFFEQLLPAALPYYEPVRLNEPCVGSGIMILAAAASVPPWMNELGLIQYTGMDTDMFCVRMARINCMLYGLNGYALQCWEAAQDQDVIDALRDPARQAEWAAIRARLEAEREARRAEEETIREERRAAAAANAENMRLETEETTGKDGQVKKKRILKGQDGVTQLEMF